jgi:hypothetical protein
MPEDDVIEALYSEGMALVVLYIMHPIPSEYCSYYEPQQAIKYFNRYKEERNEEKLREGIEAWRTAFPFVTTVT